MKAVIVYDSVFGNTRQVALAIEKALAEKGQVEIFPVGEVSVEMIRACDLFIIGSPTRGFRPTEVVAKLLKSLSKQDLNGRNVAAFDTRILLSTIDSAALRFVVNTGGYAAPYIAKTLKRKGGNLIAPPEGFYVTGEQGPLQDGELSRAAEWASQIADMS
jgi:flavodoxin